MKKKTRNIIVNDKNYVWIVTETDWPKHLLRIWKSEDKSKPWIEKECEEANPITPRFVASLIASFLPIR